ncbi:hypothetical protein AAFF_G00437410 [Aldrovandia affinis]|uniref:TERF1-interacting nuclear factor 2 N-terminal domain-containing protein n=1 Tax=Aldrovandia affinis TaxID=143900 RepID=A0AAD7S7L8_9TELE|nr:hypothetical protein AAFF_G00437410 [Aldrovandia affinis]
MWQVVQQQDVLHYGKLEEFVSLVMETVPELLSDRQRTELTVGLRVRVREGPNASITTPDDANLQVRTYRTFTGIDLVFRPNAPALRSCPSAEEEMPVAGCSQAKIGLSAGMKIPALRGYPGAWETPGGGRSQRSSEAFPRDADSSSDRATIEGTLDDPSHRRPKELFRERDCLGTNNAER